MSIQYYYTSLPQVNELVLIHFTSFKESHIEGQLIEYPECEAFLSYNDATKKKKINNWNKYIPLNKDIVARVESIENNTVIVSLVFDKNACDEDKRSIFLEPFQLNKQLISIVKKMCFEKNYDFNDIWTNMIYQIDEKKHDDYDPESFPSLLTYCYDEKENLIELFNDTIYQEIYETFISYLNKHMTEKPHKLITKIEIVSNGGIDNTILIFNKAIENIKCPFNLKYISAPIYHFETMTDESDINIHNEFIQNVKNESEKMNPKTFVKINSICEKLI